MRLVADSSEEHLGGDAGFFVLAQAMGELAFGKLLVVVVHDERVVQVDSAFFAAKCFHERYLAGCGVADIFSADDMCDLLVDVVDANGKLVGPLVVAVADREVAALEFWVLVKVPEAQVVPVDNFIGDDKAQVVRSGIVKQDFTGSFAFAQDDEMFAFSLINDFTGFALRVLGEELLAAAIARINERFVDKFLEGGFVDRSAGTLYALGIVLESKPLQIFSDACDVSGARATLVMVFDSQMDF